MIVVTDYKLILLMYCLEDGYEINHNEVLLADIDNIEDGEVYIYSVIRTDSKMKALLKETTDEEVVNDLCSLYGLVKMDMELYKDLKDRFDKGLLRK